MKATQKTFIRRLPLPSRPNSVIGSPDNNHLTFQDPRAEYIRLLILYPSAQLILHLCGSIYRSASSCSRNCSSGTAPTNLPFTKPSLPTKTKLGKAVTPNCAIKARAFSCVSALIRSNFTLPSYSLSSLSTTGLIVTHAGHHSVKNSYITATPVGSIAGNSTAGPRSSGPAQATRPALKW